MKGLLAGIGTALIAAAILSAAYFAGVFPGSPPADEEDVSGVPAPGHEDAPEMVVGGGAEAVVEGDEYEFDPGSLTFERGDSIRLTFRNSGNISHTWTIDALNVDTGPVAPGQSRTVEFDAIEAGTYEIYCAIPGHRESGMVGTLVVE